MAKTSVDIPQLKFNKMSTAKYEELKLAGQLNDNEFYITPDDSTLPEVNESTNDFVLSNNGTDLNWVQETEYTKNRIDSKLDDNIRTNCITKIPQDIHLELNDGTLTLKAGSKVYIPNGVGVFDEYIFSSDLIRTKESSLYDIPMVILLYRQDINFIDFFPLSRVYSGNTEPDTSTYDIWFDTLNNKIKTNLDTVWTETNTSLPFAIGTVSSTSGFVSIDQVFNGFGYIGSTIFALPGVEGLIPNGRNTDGSLNNIKFTTSNVVTRSDMGNDKNLSFALNIEGYFNYGNYNINGDNYLISGYGSNLKEFVCGTYQTDSTGRIINLNYKNVFQLIDKNNGLTFPQYDKTETITFTSNQSYVIPYDCELFFCQSTNSDGGNIKLRYGDAQGPIIFYCGSSTFMSVSSDRIYLKKGTRVYCENFNGTSWFATNITPLG